VSSSHSNSWFCWIRRFSFFFQNSHFKIWRTKRKQWEKE
jgi:hypothetical protein